MAYFYFSLCDFSFYFSFYFSLYDFYFRPTNILKCSFAVGL